MNRVTAKIILYQNQDETPQGYPIKVRVTKFRKTRFIHLGTYARLKDWDEKRERVRQSHPQFIQVMRTVKEAELKILECIERDLSLDQSVVLLKGGESFNSRSFSQFAREYLSGLKNAKRIGTAKAYETAVLQLEYFCQSEDIMFSELTYGQLVNFRNYKLGMGMSNSGVHNYLRSIRVIVNEAINNGHMNRADYPFKRGLMPKIPLTRKRALSMEVISQLEQLALEPWSLPDVARRMFLLQFYFAGMDYVDLVQLRLKQIGPNSVYFLRHKLGGGGYELEIPMIKKAQEQVNFFKQRSDNDRLLSWHSLPEVGQKYKDERANNVKRLKRLLPGVQITTKSARHTFASEGRRKGVDPDLLAQLMGHEVPGYQVANIYKEDYTLKELTKALLAICGGKKLA